MKRALRIACLPLLSLCLTSCKAEVHWFGESTYVPWYVVVVPVVALSVLCLLVAHIVIIRTTFQCPKCGATFKPGRFEIRTWLHAGDSRVAKCPQCGFTGFCKRHKEDT